MGGIHDALKDDDVNGVIIGGECIVGYLTYEGRRQGKQLYAGSEGHLHAMATQYREEIIESCGMAAREIYPDSDAWCLRILN